MIPTDLRRFGLKHLVLATTSIAIAFSIVSFNPRFGYAAAGFVSTFWIGMTGLWCSDVLDGDKPIDDRNWQSQFFNLLGTLLVVVATIGSIGWFAYFFICMFGVWVVQPTTNW